METDTKNECHPQEIMSTMQKKKRASCANKKWAPYTKTNKGHEQKWTSAMCKKNERHNAQPWKTEIRITERSPYVKMNELHVQNQTSAICKNEWVPCARRNEHHVWKKTSTMCKKMITMCKNELVLRTSPVRFCILRLIVFAHVAHSSLLIPLVHLFIWPCVCFCTWRMLLFAHSACSFLQIVVVHIWKCWSFIFAVSKHLVCTRFFPK